MYAVNNPPLQQFTLPNVLPLLEIRETVNSTLPYAEHFHSSFSLGLILAGRTCFSLGKERHVAETGDIVLIAPGEAHSCNPVGAPRSYLMAYLDAAWFHEHMGTLLHREHGVRIRKPLVRDGELFVRVREIFDAVRAGSFPAAPSCADPATVEQRLTNLLLRMQARHQCFLPASNAQGRNDPARTIRPIADKIMAGDYSIGELAHRAGVRRESFSRSFHRTTGLPPSNYLHCLRLEYGRRLLREGCSIAQAAVAAGYVDQSHFHRMFLKYCSVTPGCYRKNRSHPYKK